MLLREALQPRLQPRHENRYHLVVKHSRNIQVSLATSRRLIVPTQNLQRVSEIPASFGLTKLISNRSAGKNTDI